MRFKRTKPSLAVLAAAIVVVCLAAAADGAVGAGTRPLTWSVPGAKITLQDVAAAVSRPGATTRWHCGTQPQPTLGFGRFTVDYNYDGSISSQPGTTGVSRTVLANEGIGWATDLRFTSINQPESQSTGTFLNKWTFTGSTSAFAPSQLVQFSYCVAVFVPKPWGYELQSSYWTKPAVETTYRFDPSLPALNTGDTGYQLAAMQAVMHLGS